jgi:high-affinity iron transporter
MQEAFGGFMSIIAVGFVTWMVFWMKKTARNIRGELHGRLDNALSIGPYAIAIVAFIAVAREGLETSLFIWAAVQSTGSGFSPIVGATLGLATAVVLGYLFYRGALKINLAKFFTYTGAALVVVAAGVLAYAVHDLQEAGILPGLENLAFDATAVLPPASWYGTLVKGIFNLSAAPSVLELVAWFAYLIPVMYLFFRKPRIKPEAPVKVSAPSTATGR